MVLPTLDMVDEKKKTSKDIIKSLEQSQDGCVYVFRDDIRWSFYVERGKVVYASHSIESFERLERHLRGLSREVPALNDKLRSQLRLIFDDPNPDNAKYKVTSEILCTEYLAILWLVNENYLPRPFASKLVARMGQEVIESFLCLEEGKFVEKYYPHLLQDTYCGLATSQILDVVEKRLQAWSSLGPTICSPHQCLYLVSQASAARRMSEETVQRLGKILKGFNFYQLGALLGKDPLLIAKQFSPLIQDGSILLRDSLPPFDLLPRTYRLNPKANDNIDQLEKNTEASEASTSKDISPISQVLFAQDARKVWKVVCIDDSESMLSIISSYLGGEDFQVTLIQDSMKALMKITSIRPDLILLDIGMPNVDGYQLCSMIRKSSSLKDIPIVMVTGNKGIIDRTRARMVGATDYLTKPFLQSDLLKMLMRHLM